MRMGCVREESMRYYDQRRAGNEKSTFSGSVVFQRACAAFTFSVNGDEIEWLIDPVRSEVDPLLAVSAVKGGTKPAIIILEVRGMKSADRVRRPLYKSSVTLCYVTS